MKKVIFTVFCSLLLLLAVSCTSGQKRIFTIGICEFTEDPSTREAEQGFIKAFTDHGLVADKDVKFKIANAQGDFPTAGLIAEKFVSEKVDMLCALATPCLQACLNTQTGIPVIFGRIANPVLAGAGKSADDHLPNVTGVATTSPFKETIALIKELVPEVRTIGTIWSPSELNSEYYMKLQKREAEKAGLVLTAVPINSSSEMHNAVLSLVNSGIDCIYQISDNLTSTGFEVEVRIAEQEKLPIFCNQTSEVERGAAIGLGWSFHDAGYEAGKIAIRVKQGENPAEIPFQSMTETKLYINIAAAERQGLKIPDKFLDSADRIFNEK